MNVGVMLRSMDEQQGIGVYTKNLMDHLLPLDRRNQYVLYYRNPQFLGRYAAYPHVREKLVTAANKVLWDQVRIPIEARRDQIDVLFHTKFTVPFLTRRKTVMVVHGAAWHTNPELFRRIDNLYVRIMMPWYCRKATAILSNSELTTQDHIRILGLNPSKIHTTRLAADDRFGIISDAGMLRQVREKYRLPERFILSVIKYDPRKNFGNLIQAFRLAHERVGCKLVVVGIGCEKYREEYHLKESGLDDHVLFLGWLEQPELPALYNLAVGLFFPSVYEEFGIPVCEAMSCGCPVVVSTTGALPEVSGEAGILVDPMNPREMAEALSRIWTDDGYRATMAQRALERAKEFSWAKCARETLTVLESLVPANRH